jgi:quercetin dioxygenase-like cupin family protein
LRLSLYEFETGAETIGGNRVVYDVARGEAHSARWSRGARSSGSRRRAEDAEGALVSRQLELDPFADWIVRCDRIDFPVGGVAHLHTHPGPGIRYLLHGEIEIHTEGRAAAYGPGGAWFESGADPVYAVASPPRDRVRARAAARRVEGSARPLRRPADEDKPKPQQATVFFDHPLSLR